MQLQQVAHDICLNGQKVGKYSFCSRIQSYYHLEYVEQPPQVKQTLQQITTNLEYVYERFDNNNVSDSLQLIRKSCIKSFTKDFVNHDNTDSAATKIKTTYMHEAKAKLLHCINKLWLYMLK